MALAREPETFPPSEAPLQQTPDRAAVQTAQRHTVLRLARAAESKDPTTGAHIERMYGYTLSLARALGLDEAGSLEIATAAMLHDVGKLAVPTRILQKTGPLTDEEWTAIRRHPVDGAHILGDSPALGVARDVVRWHHERWDGTGYPDGLRGEEIPLHVALVAVTDVYDALTSYRPYKPPWEEGTAICELRRIAGVHLHPIAVSVFVDLWERGELAMC